MASRDVVVLSAVRSPIGAFGGSLADFDSSELAGLFNFADVMIDLAVVIIIVMQIKESRKQKVE